MNISESAMAYHEKMFPGKRGMFMDTDPEFAERFDNFAFDEVVNSDDLDDRTRFMAILAALIGCQGIDAYRAMLPAALNFGVTPVEAREIVYQSTAYLGIGRALPFIKATSQVLDDLGIELPLENQATTTVDDRVEKGNEAQVAIFGEGMRGFQDTGPEDRRHINRWLAGHCFGDWYTRGGLDLAQREMITFCLIAAQGGCEPQLISHAIGNMNIGNDKAFLVKIVSQLVPYIGYPRSLNALACVDKAAEQLEG